MQNNHYQKELNFLQNELANCKDELKRRDILRILNSITYKYDAKLHLNYLNELDKWYNNQPKDFIYFRNRVFFINYFREKPSLKMPTQNVKLLSIICPIS